MQEQLIELENEITEMEDEQLYREWKALIKAHREIPNVKRKIRKELSSRGFVLIEKPALTNKKPSERTLKMVSLYKEGKTLQEIGNLYGFSREYIRQIITRFGITSEEGGARVRTKEEWESTCRANGCTRVGKKAKGFCSKHYGRFMKYGDPLLGERKTIWKGRECVVADCKLPMKGNHLCNKHNVNYIINLKTGNITNLDDYLEVQEAKQMMSEKRPRFPEIREFMKSNRKES